MDFILGNLGVSVQENHHSDSKASIISWGSAFGNMLSQFLTWWEAPDWIIALNSIRNHVFFWAKYEENGCFPISTLFNFLAVYLHITHVLLLLSFINFPFEILVQSLFSAKSWRMYLYSVFFSISSLCELIINWIICYLLVYIPSKW